MTNDISTLSGALLEMKDQLIYELGQKGVTATYDSSTGLLGLISKIGDIQTGGGSGVPCYNVSFTSNSWNYTDYSFANNTHYVHLELYLQYQYEPYSGTITVTDGTNTYTLTTNSNGLATLDAPVTNNSTTFTASYTNTTDTFTISKSQFLLIDKCNSSSGLSNYAASVPTYKSTSGSPASTLSYDSTMGTYKIVATNTSTTYYSMIPIIPTYDETDYVAEIKIYDNYRASNSECGLFVKDRTSTSTSTYGVGADMNDYASNFYIRRQSSSSTSTSVTTASSETLAQKKWYTLRLEVNDTGIHAQWFNENGSKIGENSYNQTISNKELGIWLRGGSTTNSTYYIKEIKIRSL